MDSALRFSKEPEYKEWKHRLQIYGLDLRHTPSVEIFALYVENNYSRLDILINNAAQTVRRPSGFYSHLMSNERLSLCDLPTDAASLLTKHNSCIQELENHTTNNKNLPVAWHSNALGVGIRSSAEPL